MLWHKKMPTQMAGFRLPCELKYIAKVDIIFKALRNKWTLDK